MVKRCSNVRCSHYKAHEKLFLCVITFDPIILFKVSTKYCCFIYDDPGHRGVNLYHRIGKRQSPIVNSKGHAVSTAPCSIKWKEDLDWLCVTLGIGLTCI